MTKPDSDDLFSIFRLSTGELVDQTLVLLEQENSPHYKCRDYLHSNSSSSKESRVSAEARAKVARWLADIVDYFSLQRQTVAMAMSYVDIFVSLRHERRASEARRSVTKFQLLALVCLSIATKSLEVAHLDVETLVTASQGCYSADDIREMEIIVLNALQWRLCAPTSLPIAHRAIALLTKVIPRLKNEANKRSSVTSCLVEFTRLQLELAVTDYTSSVLRKPSTVALASILNSMDLLDFDNRERTAFSRVVSELTGLDIHSIDVLQARQELNEVFDKKSDDVISGASVGSSSVSTSSRSRRSSSDRSCRSRSRSSRRTSSTTASTSLSSAASTSASLGSLGSFNSVSYHSRTSHVGVDETLIDAPPAPRRTQSKRVACNKYSYKEKLYDGSASCGSDSIPRASELFHGFGQSRF
mmetsp:Transcript_21275/g.30456  ORF Transcript_21275/g.30456 Transcript_21275/m.30456 type:complete len:415 (-) Transcript_21275:60-1304(-)